MLWGKDFFMMGLRKYNKQLFDETTDGYIQILKLKENDKIQIENVRYEDLEKIEKYKLWGKGLFLWD